MGADRAASVIFRKELASAPDPVQRLRELVTEYSERLMPPYIAAERGMVDDVMTPRRPVSPRHVAVFVFRR
jgi:acetyl-CoA carboxylase carboxyltransferase component